MSSNCVSSVSSGSDGSAADDGVQVKENGVRLSVLGAAVVECVVVALIISRTLGLLSIPTPWKHHSEESRRPTVLLAPTELSVTTSTVADSEFAKGAEYALGTEGRRDLSTAAVWYLRAAQDGSVSAQSMLAECYRTSRGVPRDYIAAYMWSAIAAAEGDDDSKYRISLMRPRMTTQGIEEAQRRAAEFLQRHPSAQTSHNR